LQYVAQAARKWSDVLSQSFKNTADAANGNYLILIISCPSAVKGNGAGKKKIYYINRVKQV